MNKVVLRGTINNIVPSHKIKDIEYYKAEITVKRNDGKEDILGVRFKRFSCNYKNGDQVCIVSNARSYSTRIDDSKNHVELYFFTYFDEPDDTNEFQNYFEIDGRICKKDTLYTNQNGKHSIHFVLANNLISSNGKKINSYLPCVAVGKTAREIDSLNIGDKIVCKGECHSRYYKKCKDNDYEIMVAHELFVKEIERDAE